MSDPAEQVVPGCAADRRRWWEAGGLALLILVVFLLFPTPGDPWWDAWMTATVLADWDAVGAGEILYFAHPLVIPLTRGLATVLFIEDPLLAAALRETLCAALAAGVLYLLTLAVLRRRLAALVVALAYTVPFEHWRGATSGEEKSALVLFALLALVPFFQLRGWLDLPPLGRLPRRWLALLTSLLLALAFAVHLQNGLLFPAVLLTTLARRDFWQRLRVEASELLLVLAPGTVLCVGFFFLCAWAAEGTTDVGGLLRWLFQYHQSEQFASHAHTFADRLLVYSSTFKEYLLPSGRWGAPRIEVAVFVLGFAAAAVLAWRAHRGLTGALLLLLLMIGINVVLFVPVRDNWDGLFFVVVLLLGLGTLRGARRWPLIPWAVAVAALLATDVAHYVEQTRELAPLAELNAGADDAATSWLAARHRRGIPRCQIARAVDRVLPAEAVVFTAGRHAVNALRVCAGREAWRAGYLGREAIEFMQPGVELSNLSRRFYVSPDTPAELLATGRPIHYLSEGGSPGRRLRELLGERWDAVAVDGLPNRLFLLAPVDGPAGP